MRAFYEFVDYAPSENPEEMGVATIRVIGCNTETELDVPYGAVIDDPAWQHYIAEACAGVLSAVDPNSEDYDPNLDNWINET